MYKNRDSNKKLNSSIFSYEFPEKNEGLCANLSGIDKRNMKWKAREIRKSDINNYGRLWTNSEVMKYLYQEELLSEEMVGSQVEKWLNIYKSGFPRSAFTIFDEQENFVGYIVAESNSRESYAEIAYALLPQYWNRGIGSSVLEKMVEEWGPEVRKIGLEESLCSQQIREKFCCFKGKVLEKFYATAKPRNIFSWNLLEKAGFEPAKIEVENSSKPFYFNDESFKLTSLKNIFEYCSEIEHYIEKLYQLGEVKIDKLYHMIDSKDKLYVFSKNLDTKIRFHYENKILLEENKYQSKIEQLSPYQSK